MRIWFLLIVLWLAAVGFLSLNPAPLDAMRMKATKSWLLSSESTKRSIQTFLHAVVFGVGAILIALALRSLAPNWPFAKVFLLSIGAVVFIGIVLEIAQTRIPNRSADLVDLGANVVGAAAFLGVAWVITRLKTNKTEQDIKGNS